MAPKGYEISRVDKGPARGLPSLILFKHKGREIKGDHIFWTHIFTPETIAGGP